MCRKRQVSLEMEEKKKLPAFGEESFDGLQNDIKITFYTRILMFFGDILGDASDG